MQNTFGDIMMKLTAKEKIIRARVKLLNDEPFFGRLLMEMKFEESERCKTMGVNRVGKCFYNPSFVDSLCRFSNGEGVKRCYMPRTPPRYP